MSRYFRQVWLINKEYIALLHKIDENHRQHYNCHMDILQVLQQLGLSEKEVSVYLALIKTGLANAATIAREAGLARQTTYSLLDGLTVKQFVQQSDKKGVRQFYADPNQLVKLINQRKEELETHKRVVEEELPKLLAKSRRARALPIVQYYEGTEGLKRLFENILERYKKGKLRIFRGYGINQFYEGMEDFLKYFVVERHRYGVDSKIFIANAPDAFGVEDSGASLGRSFKRLDIEEQQAAVYMVGNAVYLFSYKDNVGVMIENQAIAQYLKDTFDIFWEKTN